jgi:hypothetical protein
MVASVADPDPAAPLSAFTASINWGDGTSASAGSITQPGGPGTNLVVSGTHTYGDEGSFQISTSIFEGGPPPLLVASAQNPAIVSEADVLTTAAINPLVFPSGFAGSTNLLKYNGSAKIVGTAAQLTDGGGGEAGSFFSSNEVSVSQFSTQFSFQLLSATSDGFTFCIQNSRNNALGAPGGGLAYFGITKSVAVKFDLHDNGGEGPDSTGIFTNGAAPWVPAIDLSNTGIDLHSGHVFNVSMTYDGTTLNVTITDASTAASASQSYAIDIPGTVGGSVAFVGFTGATGGGTAIQNIQTWTYTPKSNVASFRATEGKQFSGVVAAFTDANTAASPSDFAATINWGDGTTSSGTVTGTAGNFVVNGSHTYAQAGNLNYSVQIQDDGPGTASLSVAGIAAVIDAPLAFIANATLPTGIEGQSVSGQLGTFIDTNPLATAASFTPTIDWGDSTTSSGTIVPHVGTIPALVAGPNVNMSKESGNQNECSLSINPTNPNNVVAWSNDESAFNGGVDEYLSNDGGATWTRRLIGANDSLEGFACCDTQSIFDSFGNLYAVNIDFGAGFTLESIKVLESFDGGNTFQVVTIQSDASFGLDQPSIAFGDGMVWVSYKDISNGAIKAAGATVTGLGQVSAFSTPEAAPGSSIGSFGNVAVSPTGQVLVVYESPSGGAGPATILANIDPDGLGPQGFGPAITVTPTNVGGFDPIPPQPNRTVDSEANAYFDRSGGPHNGRAYLVYTDAPSVGSQATDIFVRISDDNGATWSNPTRVTDDSSGNSHFNPQMAIDPTTGNVAIAWYDSRNAGAADQTAQIFATLSTDSGATWMPNIQVSAGTSNVTVANSGIDYGDYMLMDFYGGTFRPIWSDNSNSTGDNADGTLSALDIYTAAVTLTSGVGFDISGSHTYTDEGNYTIKVQVADSGGSNASTNSRAHVIDAALTASPATFAPVEQTGFTGKVGSFTDSNAFGKASDFSASIDWGNGNISNGTIVANTSGGFDVIGTNTYAEEGSFQVKVSVRDVGGSTTNMTSTAVIVDAPLTPTGLSLTGVEAGTVSGQVGRFQDSFTNSPLTDFTTGGGRATINWGDGSQTVTGAVTQPGGVGTAFAVSGSHVYSDAGTYTVTVTLRDKGGSSATAMSTVTVADAPLSAIGIALQLVEGSPFTGQVAAFVDANPKATLATFTAGGGSVTIDWGDGSPVVPAILTQPQGPGSAFIVSGSHTYTDERSYTIHVAVTDRGGATAQSLASALVLDAGLTASGVAVNAFDGTTFSGTVATFVDANPFAGLGDFSAGQGYVRIDWGDGFTSLGTVSQPGGPGSQFVASGAHTYAQVGTRQIQVNIFDVGGSQASATSTATIGDAPIHLSTGPLTMTEGANFSGTVGTLVDLSSSGSLADFTTGSGGATIDWGDTFLSAGTISQPGGAGTPFVVSGSHVYQEEGSYTVKVKVTDQAGSQDQSSFNATVGDAALSAAGAPAKQFDGLTYAGTLATITDANLSAPLTDFTTGQGGATIDWGDGSAASAGTVTQPGGTGTPFIVQGTHTYAKLGTYSIKVTVQEVGGSKATASTSLTLVHFDDVIGRNSSTGQWNLAVSNGSSAFTSIPFGSWDPSKTWVDVQVGDFNGDGRPDVAGRDAATGNWWVGLSSGSGFSSSMWGHWSSAVSWSDVRVGDFNGDGKMDIAGRFAAVGQWWLALSTGSSFVNSLWATWSANPGVTWADVKVGDFNGDGKADLTGRWLQGGSWWTAVSTGTSFVTSQWAQWNPTVTWADVQVGDFNGDGKADIAGRWLQTGLWYAGISIGTAFTTSLWASWSSAVTWSDVKVGDFNGDGKADIIGRAMPSNQWWVGLSTGSGFQTNLWTSWSPGFTWTNIQVGDFNGDGKTDLAGFALEAGAWWTSLSSGSAGITSLWGIWPQPNSWVDVHTADFA